MTPTAATAPLVRPISLLDLAARLFRRRPARQATVQDDAEQTRLRCGFILDKMHDNPEAFASEYDVQAMTSLFPRDF